MNKTNKTNKYPKQRIYYIAHKIYTFLRENPDHIVIDILKKNVEGMYEPDTNIISLDPRKAIIPTLIHELIHHWHEDWCETKVLKEEDKIVRSLSVAQMKNVIKLLGDTL